MATPPNHPLSLTAIILAGGRSQRMGQDKALLKVGSQTLLEHTVQAAHACTDQIVVVTPWAEHYQAVLGARSETWRWLLDPQPGQGPLAAFRFVLSVIETEWLLVLACDLPGLAGTSLQQWSQDLRKLPPSALAYLPQTQTEAGPRWEPLCGFYRQAARASLASAWEQGERSFQGWLAQVPVTAIQEVPPSLLVNCNTPADWAEVVGKSHP